MKVLIRLHGHLQLFFTPAKEILELDLESPKKLEEIVTESGIPFYDIGLFSVNGEMKQPDYVIREGDKIELIPVISGG